MISILLSTVEQKRPEQIALSIDSVLRQTFEDFELVVCDDSSDEKTSTLLQERARSDSRIVLFQNPAPLRSSAQCFARAAEHSNPERPFVSFLSADCSLLPRALKALADPLRTSDSLGFTFGTLLEYNSDDSFERVHQVLQSESSIGPSRLAGVLLRKSLEGIVGWLDGNILIRDYSESDYWQRLIDSAQGQSVHRDTARWSKGPSLRTDAYELATIVSQYRSRRDEDRWPLSRSACLHHPQDKIPVANWTRSERRLAFATFVRYFLSIGNLSKAEEWAGRLESALDSPLPLLIPSHDLTARSHRHLVAFRCGLSVGHERSERIATELAELKSTNALLEEQLRMTEQLHSKLQLERSSLIEELRSSTLSLENERLIAEEMSQRTQQVEQELLAARVELSALRHRLVDRINLALKRPPLLHRTLKGLTRKAVHTLRRAYR